MTQVKSENPRLRTDNSGSNETSRPFLNPFAFPSETRLLTVVLALAIVGIYLTAVHFIVFTEMGSPKVADFEHDKIDVLEIFSHAGKPDPLRWPKFIPSLLKKAWRLKEDPQRKDQVIDQFHQMADSVAMRSTLVGPWLGWVLLLCLALLSPAGAFYLTHGWRLRRLRRMRPLSDAESPPLQSATEEIVEEVNSRQRSIGGSVPPPITFLTERGAIPDAQAFGLPHRYAVVLTRSLKGLLRKDFKANGRPFHTRALITHELAHFVNHDVGRAYWALAAKWLLLIFMIAMLALTWLANFFEIISPMEATLRMLLGLGAIELARRCLLRFREHDADLRAGLFWGCRKELDTALRSHSSPGKLSGRRWQKERFFGAKGNRLWSWGQRLMAQHPDRATRREMLAEPEQLFRITSTLPWLTGFLFGYMLLGWLFFFGLGFGLAFDLTWERVCRFTIWLMENHDVTMGILSYYLYLLPLSGVILLLILMVLLFASGFLISGTIGVQIQRESVAQIVWCERGPMSYIKLLRPAFLLALGIEFGILTMPLRLTLPNLQAVGVLSFWLAAVTLLIWFWMSMVQLLARRFLGSHTGNQPPRIQRRLLTTLTTLLFATMLIPILAGQFAFWDIVTLPNMIQFSIWSLASAGLLVFLALFLLACERLLRWTVLRPQCVTCGQRAARPQDVASSCQHCGVLMSPWLFIPQNLSRSQESP